MNEKRYIAINSFALYVIAFILTTVLHEFGHALVGLLNGGDPVLHNNFVEFLSLSRLTVPQKIATDLAGPFSSLVQGLVVGWVFIKTRKQSVFSLFLLWFSLLGLINFFGYLMTGPIFQAGDIGTVYLLLHLPLLVQVLLAIFGVLVLTYVAYRVTKPFLRFGYHIEWLDSPDTRKNFAFHVIIIPWLAGATVVSLLYLPVIAIVSIIYPLTSGMIFIFPWQNAKRIKNIEPSKVTDIGKPAVRWYVLLFVLIGIFKFVLAPGIPL